jgi:CzcA family heavy metal efflux pump
MLQAVISWSIHNRVVVLFLALVLLGLGAYAAANARLDVFPEFAPPQVVIQTEAPGLSPTEVEQLVTLRVEAAINGLPRLGGLRSKSVQGLSVITAIFLDGTDIYRARQQVGERLAELAGQLPAGVGAPRMAPLTAVTGRLLTVGLTSERLSLMELRDLAQWDIRPRLLAVPGGGVAQVTLFGGEERQFQVQVYPDALAARRLTLMDVLEATRQASGVRGAGFQENDRQRLTVRALAQVQSAAQLADAVITTSAGTPVRLRDVAQVVDGPAPKFGDAAIGDKPGVLLIVHRQPDADTPDLTRRVEAELEKLRPMLERRGVTYHPGLFRQASFIEHAVGNVTESLLLGAGLVAVVLFVFLLNLRTALISLSAIPLSLLSAVLVLWACGVSLNTLTLGGLAIAVGEVVDDAIIDVENIFRRLRENAALTSPRPAASVVLSASLEVRGAVVYATFIVVLVFVPVFFLGGLQGRLFAPLGYAYVLAVLASLGVALTVTPALAMVLLPTSPKTLARESPLLRRLQAGYERLLRRVDREAALLLTATFLLLAAAGWALWHFGGQFLPELRESHFVIHMRGAPGTSLSESLATGRRVMRELAKDPAVVSVSQQAGRAELGEDTWGVEYSELEVTLRPSAAEDIEAVDQRLKRLTGDVPGYRFRVLPFLSERIEETLAGVPGDVVVKVFGDDLEAIDRAARQVAQVLAKVPGGVGIAAEAQGGAPELVVRIRPEEAARHGLRHVQVLDALHALCHGAEVGQVYKRNRTIDLVVLLDPAARSDPEAIANMWLSVPGGTAGGEGRVQLKQVADVYLSDGRFSLAHEGGMRLQRVTCNVAGRDVGSFVAEAEQRLRELRLPEGTYYVVGGAEEARRAAQRDLLLLSLVALAGVLLLLWLAFGSVRGLALTLLNLPFALVGGVAAVYMRGGILDVGALIGFVTLFGISTRNSIMLVSHWQHLHSVEGMPWGPDLIVRGARERLAPVLMTALVTGLGLLPLALGSGEAGREIEGPMALVILGGLISSTTLNLLLLPLLYQRLAVGRPPLPA